MEETHTTPSGISERQNTPQALRYLAAQRQLYTEEKWLTYLWLAIATAVALGGTEGLTALSQHSGVISALAVIIAVTEIFVLPRIQGRRWVAAGIQEEFDGEVLGLRRNRALPGQPDPNEVEWAVARFKRRRNPALEWEKLKNWYGCSEQVRLALQTAPLERARLACQGENLYWDAGLRRFWRNGLIVLLGVVIAVLVIIGVANKWTMDQYFSGRLLLLLPLVYGVLNTVKGQNDAMERLARLSGELEHLRESVGTLSADEILARTRDLQTEIYHHRCEDSPVPDKLYEWLKKRFSR